MWPWDGGVDWNFGNLSFGSEVSNFSHMLEKLAPEESTDQTLAQRVNATRNFVIAMGSIIITLQAYIWPEIRYRGSPGEKPEKNVHIGIMNYVAGANIYIALQEYRTYFVPWKFCGPLLSSCDYLVIPPVTLGTKEVTHCEIKDWQNWDMGAIEYTGRIKSFTVT